VNECGKVKSDDATIVVARALPAMCYCRPKQGIQRAERATNRVCVTQLSARGVDDVLAEDPCHPLLKVETYRNCDMSVLPCGSINVDLCYSIGNDGDSSAHCTLTWPSRNTVSHPSLTNLPIRSQWAVAALGRSTGRGDRCPATEWLKQGAHNR
jgi:hypothetical protein